MNSTYLADATLRTAVEAHVARDAELNRSRGTDRAAIRRAVARGLAAEGVVASPQVWARLVRELVDHIVNERQGPLSAPLGTLDGYEVTYA